MDLSQKMAVYCGQTGKILLCLWITLVGKSKMAGARRDTLIDIA